MAAISNKVFSGSLAIIIVAALGWGFSERRSRAHLQSDLDKEKLKSESILSEKLSIEKERDKSNRQVLEAFGKNRELSQEIEEIRKKLNDSAIKLQQVLNENSGSKKKYNELLTAHHNLEKQLVLLTGEQQLLEDKNQQLKDELSALQAENKKLQDDLNTTRLTRFDKPLVEAIRGGKMVVKASRVKMLRATLTVSNDANEIKFALINPKGTTLTENDGAITSRIVGSSPSSKQIEMTFSPKKKLQPGLYQIEVVSGTVHIAGLQVSLR